MGSSFTEQLARVLQEVDVRVETEEDARHVVLSGENDTYRSSSLSTEQARAVQQVLRSLRDVPTSLLQRPQSDIVEACRRQHPNVPGDTIRTMVERARAGAWTEAELGEALARKSRAQVLKNYAAAGVWGVLVLAQQDNNVCTACRRLDTVAYAIDHALAEQPLPHADCANRTCRCQYLPVVQEEDLYSTVETRAGAR
jgi:hypothetical protein